jgi:hypothetical protein
VKTLDAFLPLAIAAIGTALIFAVHFILQVFPGQDRESRTR